MFSFTRPEVNGWSACSAATRGFRKLRRRKNWTRKMQPAPLMSASNYGEDWQNRHLYHLMISSSLGEKEAVSIILSALHYAQDWSGSSGGGR